MRVVSAKQGAGRRESVPRIGSTWNASSHVAIRFDDGRTEVFRAAARAFEEAGFAAGATPGAVKVVDYSAGGRSASGMVLASGVDAALCAGGGAAGSREQPAAAPAIAAQASKTTHVAGSKRPSIAEAVGLTVIATPIGDSIAAIE